MIKVTVIAMAKLKEKYLKDACAEYEKRLSRYCSLEIIELEPVRLPEKPSDSEITLALEREAKLIFKRIPSDNIVIATCIEGAGLSSEQFAEKFRDLNKWGKNVTFIIGSSYGISKRIKQKSDVKISASKMTFPHQLFRVMLLEQIYRAFKINEGGSYHK